MSTAVSTAYAHPTHAYLDLSPELDFERKLFAKTNAAELLRRELHKPGYRCEFISLGANTDPYQPIERRYRITRAIIEVLAGAIIPSPSLPNPPWSNGIPICWHPWWREISSRCLCLSLSWTMRLRAIWNRGLRPRSGVLKLCSV